MVVPRRRAGALRPPRRAEHADDAVGPSHVERCRQLRLEAGDRDAWLEPGVQPAVVGTAERMPTASRTSARCPERTRLGMRAGTLTRLVRSTASAIAASGPGRDRWELRRRTDRRARPRARGGGDRDRPHVPARPRRQGLRSGGRLRAARRRGRLPHRDRRRHVRGGRADVWRDENVARRGRRSRPRRPWLRRSSSRRRARTASSSCPVRSALLRAHVDAFADRIAAADVCVVQLEIPLDTALYALEVARAAGVRTILNPGARAY